VTANAVIAWGSLILVIALGAFVVYRVARSDPRVKGDEPPAPDDIPGSHFLPPPDEPEPPPDPMERL
jgi:hypothetical protein